MESSSGPSLGPPPSPISWPPLEEFLEADSGKWSAFALRVGTPEQTVRVLISTAGHATWVVLPGSNDQDHGGLSNNSRLEDWNDQDRGGVFNQSRSIGWKEIGNYSLGLEFNLDSDPPNATYGLDTVALGISPAIGGPSLESQVVAAYLDVYYFVGMFGLGSYPIYFNITESHPTFLTTLKQKGLIPSVSWSYTAGAPYQSNGFPGSLTFGGYDISRFVFNEVLFSLSPNASRDLVVNLQSITSENASGSSTVLLSSSISIFIDSTTPFLYLPSVACDAFRDTFGLVWNEHEGLFLIDEKSHEMMQSNNPNITFTIGQSKYGGPVVQIVFPYASFELDAKPPFVKGDKSIRYFPLQPAAHEEEYTLGRAFLQEAYLITNYENYTFSVSQCKFEAGLTKTIIAIPSSPGPNSTTTLQKDPHAASIKSINHGFIAGAILGGVVFLILVFLTLKFLFRRWQRRHHTVEPKDPPDPPSIDLRDLNQPIVLSLRENDTNSSLDPREMFDSGRVELRGEFSRTSFTLDTSQTLQDQPTVLERTAHPNLCSNSGKDDTMERSTTPKSPGRLVMPDKSRLAMHLLCPANWSRLSKPHTPNNSPSDEIASSFLSIQCQFVHDLDRSLPATPNTEARQSHVVSIRFPSGHTTVEISGYWDVGLF